MIDSIRFCNRKLFNSIFSQPNAHESNRSIFRHRKIASSFRDKNLYEFFQLAQGLLKSALDELKKNKILDDDEQTLISNLLKLIINCLSFDFIGASSDDSSDDLTCKNFFLKTFKTLKIYKKKLFSYSNRCTNSYHLATGISRYE